jgi:glucoside 3-dehydrogenase (cytochrome c) catalytic subunit
MSTPEFDAIVIGSGVTGGWAARELTGKGLKTLMLDRGRMVEHRKDYPTEGHTSFNMPYRGQLPPGVRERDHFRKPWVNPYDYHFYNNDRLNPYVYDPDKPFTWIRADVFGGKSLLWGRHCYRWSDLDFEANRRDGHGIDWPLRYKDIAPWYSYVERIAGIQGERLGLPQLPDGELLPPIDLNVAERHFKQAVAEQFDGRVVTVGRTANLTEDRPEQGRTRCQFRDQCSRGCSFGAYFSTQSTTLPAAQATGNLSVLSDALVASLEYDEGARKVTGVHVIDTKTMKRTTYRSRIVFLCASCIASTQILLNSTSKSMPNGLGNGHDVLGRHLMDHPWGAGATGTLPALSEFVEYGRRPTGMYIPRFRNLDGQDPDVDFLRGYNFQSWGGGRTQPVDHSGFGAELKHRLRVPGPWLLPLYAFPEALPHADNRMMLDVRAVDRFGIPQVRFDVTWHDNELKLVADAVDQAVKMLEAAGCTQIDVRRDPTGPGNGIHEMGTARMGDDPRESVVNKWNQLHAADNVYLTDGAAMTSASCVNPSLTFMAFTARAADHAVTLVRSNQL